ncbi:sulfotransferase family protein [Thiocystis violacea]|uniref:sulfotransferase family protein n=1 Tax=Thiocystis violacea TaxID=13725 RepID=UPI0019051066|nr:sulfotransferase [Thiocystis violacea]MBK1720267.1 hypothetical protein [Thiocystis violacea]
MQTNQRHGASATVYHLNQREPNPRTTEATSTLSAPLVFVTGASRSGTTMLARMLGAHSQILTFNELHFFGSLWDPHDDSRKLSARDLAELAAILLARQTNGLWGGSPTDVERAWGRRLVSQLPDRDCTPAALFAATLRRLAEDASRTYACEQTPRNIFYARRLLELYPNARIVHIVRDPRAVLASQKNRWRLRQLGAHHLPMSEMLRNRVNYHPLTMGKLWARATEEALRLDGHPRFTILRFEDLAANAEEGARHLCRFLGLKYESGMLEIPRWGSSNLTHDSGHKGVAPEAVGQWREHLSRGEIRLCERINQLLMQRFNYPLEHGGDQDGLSTLTSLISYPLHVAGVVALNPVRAWIQLRAMVRAKAVGHRAQGAES